MQSIIENYCRKNLDKVLHFIAGMMLALFVFFWWGFIFLPLIVGIGKELHDKYVKRTKFDIYDILATIAGSIPVLIVWVCKLLFYLNIL